MRPGHFHEAWLRASTRQPWLKTCSARTARPLPSRPLTHPTHPPLLVCLALLPTRPSWCVRPSSPPVAAATTSCHAATRRRGGARRCGAKSPAPGSRASHVTPVRAHAALALLLPAAAAPQAAPVLPAGPSGRMPCRPVTPARQCVGCYSLLDHPGPGRAAAPPLPAGVLAPPELRHVNAAAAAACPTAWLQRSRGRRCSAAICTGSGGRKSAW